MSKARWVAIAAVASAALAVGAPLLAQTRKPVDLTGSWERYRAPPGDPTNPPP